MCTKYFLPKKFLCYYPLSVGSIFASVFFICITIACGFASFVQGFKMIRDSTCSNLVWRNAFSHSLTTVICSTVMLFIHAWMFWGVRNQKSSVVLSWIVITSMWLIQTFVLLLILVCLYFIEVSVVEGIISFVFTLIVIGILIYITLVVYGYWLELKGNRVNGRSNTQ